MKAQGLVHKYGSNVDTDVIIPARYLNTANHKELAAHCMEDIDKEFIHRVKQGDLIVADHNFGCGSSREHAPIAIKAAGVSCVIAKSFARIFYRNAINIGLPILECPEASDGIRSGGVVTISGNTVNAAGGYGGKVGGYGICSFDRVAISGGTVEAAGGNGSTGGGSGIYSSVIDLSGSLELTAKAGSPNGKALSQRGNELELDTIKDKLGPGAKVTATDADGKVIQQVSIPRPVEPEESSSSSDGGSAAPSAPASPLPGLTVTDKDGQRISYTSTQSGNTLTVCVGRFTASFRISLAALRQLRAEGIETITFQTILCSTTLSVDELLAMGGEDAEVVLTHHIRSSTLTVGGKAV